MGITIAKKEQKLGIRASSTCALSFDDLRVPAENVLGGEGTSTGRGSDTVGKDLLLGGLQVTVCEDETDVT